MNIIKKITEKAESLRALREAINTKEQEVKAEIDAMKVERDAIQESLLADMKKHKLASVKVESGESFIKSQRKNLEVVSEVGALKWALENKCYSLNKIVAMQKLKDMNEIPDCFDMTTTEYISVRKPKKDE